MADFTEEQYNTLVAAIAEGVLKVEYGDKKVEYRSLSQMIELKNMMAADLGKLKVPRRTVAGFSKGLYNDCPE